MHKDTKKKTSPWIYVILHISLMFSSISGLFSKKAAYAEFFSREWFLFYFGMLLIMFFYAIIWQQILRYLPLSVAYANKPVGLAWGMIWGALFFQEEITWNMILGSLIIFIGIYLVVTADG
ncbi:hypothetical protein BRYFOR_05842 [Marvinbryantia formatexigens DSM 14469]|uniref:Uncharacterized protein n=1 Tax=Marvinbryantia formatexigens DSM 14469 TaxID=478749 RepID=C6LB47_9FIRM|nr:EamA family transporter [Marvinbryantia formatexigens]EET62178.1 hypothetical protein BRYFOR_05842 [Marvinbryantia formatexigens DSM 14469]UWO26485.1 EamA family transporter [Marvinbryantia formatexigens DSM 14469]SDF78919.1 EamA-like transporter family protein [Marvinbryantia formatexigens]